ncbi:MAG: hypothetical protein ABIG93_00785 [archaeon]
MLGGVKAKCPKCNQDVDANGFQLDYKAGKMVCQNCFNNRNKPVKEITTKPKGPEKPAGWDKEDELLEQLAKERRSEMQGIIEKVPGSMQVNLTCPNCRYRFKYNPLEKRPKYCPYCGKDNPNIKVTGIF